jgi:alanine racemase
MKSWRTWIEINERSLQHNINALRALLEPNARFCAVIKANAYGHGMNEIASIAHRTGVDAFAVDNIDEALQIREKYPSALIIVLGFTMFDRYKDAINSQIYLTLYDKEGIEHAQSVGHELAKTVFVNLKIETGTMRQGVSLEDLSDLALQIGRANHIKLDSVSTHFADVENHENNEASAKQFGLFEKAINILASHGLYPSFKHCACSAAHILFPQTHMSLCRVGIAMYGLWPSESVQNNSRKLNINLELKPVLEWKTRVAQIKNIEIGTSVGYGFSEKIKRSGRIAILPVGYSDGYPRNLSSIGEVLISGQSCKIIGRVCMNMMMVDVSNVPSITKENEVKLIGIDGMRKVSVEDLATKANTINYEIVSRINPTLARIII